MGGKKRKPGAVIKAKGGKSNISPNNHPGGCIRQVRVGEKSSQFRLNSQETKLAMKKHIFKLEKKPSKTQDQNLNVW